MAAALSKNNKRGAGETAAAAGLLAERVEKHPIRSGEVDGV